MTYVNLETHAKGYISANPSPILEETFVPSRGTFQIPHPNTEKIPRIPKEPHLCTPHNPHMKAIHNYSHDDDFPQLLASMSTLEVLQYYPTQCKTILNALGAIDPLESFLMTFDLDKGEL